MPLIYLITVSDKSQKVSKKERTPSMARIIFCGEGRMELKYNESNEAFAKISNPFYRCGYRTSPTTILKFIRPSLEKHGAS
jgi:hypothetical protein